MPNDYEELDKLLGGPLEIITLGGEEIRLYPAGLPELRDVQRKCKEVGLKVGDYLPGQDKKGEKPIDADAYARQELNVEMWSYYFWLCIRQGTPGMTRQKVLDEQWDERFKAAYAQRLLSIYARERGVAAFQMATIEIAKKVGLFSGESEEEVNGESPKVESTQTSLPPQSSETNTESPQENGGESGSLSSGNSE